MGLLDAFRRWRADSWRALFTGVGVGTGRTDFRFRADGRLDDELLEQLYWGDAYANRIVSVVPQEALRQGVRLTCDDPSAADATMARFDALKLHSRVLETWTWGRLWGGAALLLGADDGRDPAEELDLAAVRTISFVVAVDKRELWPLTWETDWTSPNFGEPSVYQLTRTAGVSVDARPIHASRVIRFDGALTNRRRRMMNASWSESELQRVYPALQQFNGAYAALATLMQDASQGVFKVKDLFALMAADSQDALKTRLELMDAARGAARAIMVDAESESFERTEVSFASLPEVLDRFLNLLAGAAEIPVTVLMGQAPAGLNATGDSDVRLFLDRIRSAQQNYLRPRLQRLFRVLFAAQDGPTQGREPPGWDVHFPPLHQPSAVEDAQLRKAAAEADAIYLAAGVVTPEEVAVSRFGRDGWAIDTQINLKSREAILATLPSGEAKTGLGDPAMVPAATETKPPEGPLDDIARASKLGPGTLVSGLPIGAGRGPNGMSQR